MLLQPNAGGTSVYSEVLSFEMMRAAYGATLQKTEMEIEYDWMGSKKTDYSCHLDGVGVVAVSVTRALKHRGVFTSQDAYELLYKKLRCVQGSNQNVCTLHRWERQILHVWTADETIASSLAECLSALTHSPAHADLCESVFMIITVSKGAPYIYRHARSP